MFKLTFKLFKEWKTFALHSKIYLFFLKCFFPVLRFELNLNIYIFLSRILLIWLNQLILSFTLHSSEYQIVCKYFITFYHSRFVFQLEYFSYLKQNNKKSLLKKIKVLYSFINNAIYHENINYNWNYFLKIC